MDNSMAIPPKIKHRFIRWSSNSTQISIYPKEVKSGTWTGICTPLVTGASFTIVKMQNIPKCPSTGEWVNRMWPLHTMEYYSALKRRDILTNSTMWMNCEDITLSEASHPQKNKYCMISLIWYSYNHQFIKTKSRMVVAGAGGRREWGISISWAQSLEKWKSFGDEWWWWLNSNIHDLMPHWTIYLKVLKMVNFVMYFLPQ